MDRSIRIAVIAVATLCLIVGIVVDGATQDSNPEPTAFEPQAASADGIPAAARIAFRIAEEQPDAPVLSGATVGQPQAPMAGPPTPNGHPSDGGLRIPSVPLGVTEGVSNVEPDRPEPRIHIVKSNDTLTGISTQYYGTQRHWRRIKSANNITDEGSLQLGQELIIPDIR